MYGGALQKFDYECLQLGQTGKSACLQLVLCQRLLTQLLGLYLPSRWWLPQRRSPKAAHAARLSAIRVNVLIISIYSCCFWFWAFWYQILIVPLSSAGKQQQTRSGSSVRADWCAH